MKILVNVLNARSLSVHCIAEDCKTPIGPFIPVQSMDVVRRLLTVAGATEAETAVFERNLEGKSHSSCWIGNLTDHGKRLLKIRV